MIPYSKQYIDKNDIENVKKILKSNFLTQGPTVEKFENVVKQNVKPNFGNCCKQCNISTSPLMFSSRFKKKVIIYGLHLFHLWHQQIVDFTVEQKLTLWMFA